MGDPIDVRYKATFYHGCFNYEPKGCIRFPKNSIERQLQNEGRKAAIPQKCFGKDENHGKGRIAEVHFEPVKVKGKTVYISPYTVVIDDTMAKGVRCPMTAQEKLQSVIDGRSIRGKKGRSVDKALIDFSRPAFFRHIRQFIPAKEMLKRGILFIDKIKWVNK